MNLGTAVALPLALLSAILTNVAYLREHDAAASLPALQARRPVHSARLLLANRTWLRAFVLETAGFLAYAAALALASLALVQSVLAGGIGILAYVSARLGRRRLRRRETLGVTLSVGGLLALGLSLIGGSGGGEHGSLALIGVWLGASGAAALVVLALGRGPIDRGFAYGIAGGILFSIGDISTKLATQGGVRAGFAVTLVIGYLAGTMLLQIGYQAGTALTVAGVATLLTNALPIAAGTVVLGEGIPSGPYGVLRVLAFVLVTAGGFLLGRPERAPRADPSTSPAVDSTASS